MTRHAAPSPLLPALLLLAAGCGGAPSEPGGRPNVLFVVWDTTRADRMSLYGYERPTTPFLETWAEDARVFEDCVSTGSSTVPSHGGMFTGLLPAEHGANNKHRHLDDRHATLAELFQAEGWATYCFAANPHISRDENFTQGFDVEEHPWDPKYVNEAMRIQFSKLHPEDRSSGLPERMKTAQVSMWDVKASGELAARGLVSFLEEKDPEQPYFAFLNYMEAHRPFLPSMESRRALMTPEQIRVSLEADRGWDTMWKYTFGLHDYAPEELEAMALTYDACIRDLDRLFAALLTQLDAGGWLDDTIVVLVGDHGEHLGEHHMLDHQYSLYQGLVRVPLVLHDPSRVEPRRVSEPVSNFDLFPTLLELAGIAPPPGIDTKAVSLLEPESDRWRLSEYPSDFEKPIRNVRKLHPEWDPSSYRRRLTALFDDGYKLIWSSDGQHELYHLASDPDEESDLAAAEAERVAEMLDQLGDVLSTLEHFDYAEASVPELSEEQKQRLEALGYLGEDDDS